MTILRPKNPQASNVTPIERQPTVANSPEIELRMNRILSNFGVLDSLLDQVEQKIATDSPISSLLSAEANNARLSQVTQASTEEQTESGEGDPRGLKKSGTGNRRAIRKPR